MGKSKSGGTRGFLRGKIANDVYSIGKDGNGKKQQVVRALAVSVANPRTTAQMRGRMIMSTIMQAVSGFAPIIDHSFDGVAVGQPSISKFIRENYALVKADVAAHPSSGNHFGLLKYKERRVALGCYKVSDGNQPAPSFMRDYATNKDVVWLTGKVTFTMGDLRAQWNAAGLEYMTVVAILDGQVVYSRVTLNPAIADAAEFTALTLPSWFLQEGNASMEISIDGGAGEKSILFNFLNAEQLYQKEIGAIYTYPVNGGYEHSALTLDTWEYSAEYGSGSLEYTSDAALPTYPTGAEQFLNGGDI